MTSDFLSASVEAGRLASAENYFNQPTFSSPPRLEPPFDLFPYCKYFKVTLSKPSYFHRILFSFDCEEYGLKFIKEVLECPDGSGKYWVTSKPYATTEQVSAELESIFVPF